MKPPQGNPIQSAGSNEILQKSCYDSFMNTLLCRLQLKPQCLSNQSRQASVEWVMILVPLGSFIVSVWLYKEIAFYGLLVFMALVMVSSLVSTVVRKAHKRPSHREQSGNTRDNLDVPQPFNNNSGDQKHDPPTPHH